MEKEQNLEGPSLLPLVGFDIYKSWVQTLHVLVPRSRSHRIKTVIAAMLYYASLRREPEAGGDVLEVLHKARELDANGGEAHALLRPLIEQLYCDAGLSASDKRAKDGRAYSIIDSAIQEFLIWENMMWE